MVKQYKQNVTMKSKVVITNLDQGKQKVTQLTLLLDCFLNHNKNENISINVHQIMCQLKRIRYKPNLHFRDFSIWPPLDIGNIFVKLVRALLLYLLSFM